MIRRARVAALLGAAIALTSCGGGGGNQVQSRARTTTTVGRRDGSSVNIGIVCSTPNDAAHAFVDAWMSGDHAAAGRCGSPTAVTTLFAHARPDPGWTFRGCVGTVCSFSYAGGTARLRVRGSDAAGWIVDRVRLGG